MRRPQNSPRLFSDIRMFALYVLIAQIIEVVHSTNSDPDLILDGHARFIQGEASAASGLQRWRAAGFFEDRHHLKVRLITAFLLVIFVSVSAVIVMMRWGCWKTGSDQNLKQQEEMSQSHLTHADGLTEWKVHIPHSTTNRSDVCAVHIPTLSNESLNHFPSSLRIGVYSGFTTGVGPRR